MAGRSHKDVSRRISGDSPRKRRTERHAIGKTGYRRAHSSVPSGDGRLRDWGHLWKSDVYGDADEARRHKYVQAARVREIVFWQAAHDREGGRRAWQCAGKRGGLYLGRRVPGHGGPSDTREFRPAELP